MGSKSNVVVFAPNSTVSSMQDEIADGSVDRAIAAAVAAYVGVDSNGQVPVERYSNDFDDAVAEAVEYAAGTPGSDIVVIITDLVSNDRPRAERLLADSDDMFVLVPVSNQGYDEAWAERLDKDADGPNNVDVVTVADLANPSVAMAEVGPFLARTAS
jgi:flavin-binding protein dodecin